MSFLTSNIFKSFIGYIFFKYLKFLKKKNITFLFHDVTNSPSEYSKENNLYLYKENFKKIINHIEKNYKIINPKLLQKNLKNNNYALITFDDGYKSFINNVKPILLKKKIPSLIFLNGEVGINAAINYFSKKKKFQLFMKKRNIQKPYYLNINIKTFNDFFKYINPDVMNTEVKLKIFKVNF